MEAPKTKSGGWLGKIFQPPVDFYDLLNAHARIVLQGVEALEQWIQKGAQERCQQVRDLENHADDLRMDLERKLAEAFVTPFDREDIYDLSARLDEVINGAKAIVREIEALNLKLHGSFTYDMAATLVEGTRCIVNSFEHLSGNLQEAANQATLARKSENRFSRIYRTAKRELFDHDDFKIILKTNEIYRSMLIVAERIDLVGEKILHVVVKMS
ncbi:MAG TPA: DUF47 family protein [Planktothrix sp.]|jgi:hypothetical protein